MGKARARNLVELNRVRERSRRGAAAPHPLRDRRARRPDDGRAGRGRGLDHPPGAEVARGRDPPGARDPAPLDRRHHGHDQGQHPGPDRVRGRLAGRLAGDPRPGRRRDACSARATCSSAAPAPRSCSGSRAPSSPRRRSPGSPSTGRARASPTSTQELLEAQAEPAEEDADGEFSPDEDDLLDDAVRIVVETETASVSMIQRRLRVGYTRAGRLIDMLERRGVISGYEGSKPRQVLIAEADLAARARRRRRRRRPSRRGPPAPEAPSGCARRAESAAE